VASHGGVMSLAAAMCFGAMGVWYGSGKDGEVSWVNPAMTGAIGVVFGALLGYGLSMEVRSSKPKGARRVLVVVGLVFCAAVVLGMRYLRYRT